jgi:hypothetical protein
MRVVRVEVGLLRHDGKVHGVVTDVDAVLKLRVCRRACHTLRGACPKTTTPPWCSVLQPRVLHIRLLRHFELAGRFCSGVDILQEATIEGPIAPEPEGDKTMGVG